jgi:hypothetical protein
MRGGLKRLVQFALLGSSDLEQYAILLFAYRSDSSSPSLRGKESILDGIFCVGHIAQEAESPLVKHW